MSFSLLQPKVDFDCGVDGDRCTIFRSWLESPFRQGLNRFLVEPGMKTPDYPNLVGLTFRGDDGLEQDCTGNPVGLRLLIVIGIHLVENLGRRDAIAYLV